MRAGFRFCSSSRTAYTNMHCSGGFSEVVKAVNRDTGQVVALKIISMSKTGNNPNQKSELAAIENEIYILKVCHCICWCAS